MQEYEKALNLIHKFYCTEYVNDSEINDLEKIPLAYTTIEDDLELQVSLDLVHLQLIKSIADIMVETINYKSLEELVEHELANLSFDCLVAYTQDEINFAKSKL